MILWTFMNHEYIYNAYNHFHLQITIYILPVGDRRLELLHARPENLGAGFDSELAWSFCRFVWLKVDQTNTFEPVRHVRKIYHTSCLLLRKLCWIRINPNFIPNVWPLQTLDSRFVRYVKASRCRSSVLSSQQVAGSRLAKGESWNQHRNELLHPSLYKVHGAGVFTYIYPIFMASFVGNIY